MLCRVLRLLVAQVKRLFSSLVGVTLVEGAPAIPVVRGSDLAICAAKPFNDQMELCSFLLK